MKKGIMNTRYQEGVTARQRGYSKLENPCEQATADWAWWMAGWNDEDMGIAAEDPALALESLQRDFQVKFSPEQMQRMKQMYTVERVSSLNIARAFGLTDQGVTLRLRRMGVEIRKPGEHRKISNWHCRKIADMQDSGMPRWEIAAKYKVSESTIFTAIRRARKTA